MELEFNIANHQTVTADLDIEHMARAYVKDHLVEAIDNGDMKDAFIASIELTSLAEDAVYEAVSEIDFEDLCADYLQSRVEQREEDSAVKDLVAICVRLENRTVELERALGAIHRNTASFEGPAFHSRWPNADPQVPHVGTGG